MRSLNRTIPLKAEAKITIGVTLMFILLLWLAPPLAFLAALTILGATLALVAGRLTCAMLEAPRPTKGTPTGDEFVSIHIATYSEPPEVVKRTLDSLVTLDYDNYEVIVLDNNTPDPKLYEPVREHCERLGDRFRFYHFDNVQGAKAGALNISLELADQRTDVILILDADYQALPNLLREGLSYFSEPTVALVQFPQAYRNSDRECGLTWEYKLFFDVYMKLANRWNTVLSTGTAAFVRRGALETSGGWSGETLTEDAELGLRLHRRGFRAVYVPQVVAAGLMPTDLKSLRVQRRRWVLGNAQSLKGLKRAKLHPLRKLLMALQLTAWANPLLLSAAAFGTSAVFHGLFGGTASHLVMSLSGLSILAYLSGTLAFFCLAVRREGGSLFTALKAYAVHLGMLWEGSVSWCELFVQSDKRFQRTDKFIRAPETWAIALSLLISMAVAGLSFKMLWLGGSIPLALSLGFASLLGFGSGVLRWNLHSVRQRTVSSAGKVPHLAAQSSETLLALTKGHGPKHKVERLRMVPRLRGGGGTGIDGTLKQG